MIDRNLGVLLIPPCDRLLFAVEPQVTGRSDILPEQPTPHPEASRGEAPAESVDEGGGMNPGTAPAMAAQACGSRAPAARLDGGKK
jgi:hypothetical protein